MLHLVWEFHVRAGRVAEFESHYGPGGSWAILFRNAPGYRGTTLLRDRDDPLRFVTIDIWDDEGAWRAFRAARAADYEALDRLCEELTEQERRIGAFESVDPAR